MIERNTFILYLITLTLKSFIHLFSLEGSNCRGFIIHNRYLNDFKGANLYFEGICLLEEGC